MAALEPEPPVMVFQHGDPAVVIITNEEAQRWIMTSQHSPKVRSLASSHGQPCATSFTFAEAMPW